MIVCPVSSFRDDTKLLYQYHEELAWWLPPTIMTTMFEQMWKVEKWILTLTPPSFSQASSGLPMQPSYFQRALKRLLCADLRWWWWWHWRWQRLSLSWGLGLSQPPNWAPSSLLPWLIRREKKWWCCGSFDDDIHNSGNDCCNLAVRSMMAEERKSGSWYCS